jgi:hypothetical protein
MEPGITITGEFGGQFTEWRMEPGTQDDKLKKKRGTIFL